MLAPARWQRVDQFCVPLRPSRLCLGMILWLAACAAAGLALTASWALVLLPGLVCLALAQAGWLRRQRQISRIEVTGGRYCAVELEGAWRPAVLQNSSVAWPWLVVLHFTLDGRQRACALFPDSAPPEGLRRLRVWVRWSSIKQ